ncbi:MAG: helix-turn-helix transcriptional regulator [Clostridia bacterium]|nr:helix-turn-helix transcriptional regulator [Clostridia bacterium]
MNGNLVYEGEHDTQNDLFTHLEVSINHRVPPHFHRCIEIIYFLKGSASVIIDGEQFTFSENDIMFAKRCATHEIVYNNCETVLLVIPPKYSDDFEYIFQNTTIPACLSDKEFNKTLKSCFWHLSSRTETLDMVIKGYINIIIGKLFEHYPNTKIENKANIDLIIKVLNYIDKHYTEQITLDSISKYFGYNKYYFSRLFNQTIGENLNSYLNGVRLANLVKYARKTDKPNFLQLTMNFGFESFSTFYRVCYNKYGMSPRKVLQNKRLI